MYLVALGMAWAGTWMTPADLAEARGDGLVTADIVRLHDGDGGVWAMGADGSVARWDGTHWVREAEFVVPPADKVDGAWTVHASQQLPTGEWLATDRGLVWRSEGQDDEVIWTPPGAVVHDLARSIQDLFLAAGDDGLWLLSGQDRRQFTPANGLPGVRAVSLAPAERDRVWVGTNRGVGLADPVGWVVPLPLSALAAGIPIRGVELPMIATADRLVWRQGKPPRGFDSLNAAVRAPGGTFRAARQWWAFDDGALFGLDRRGVVRRYDVPEGVVISAFGGNESVAVATTMGLYFWVPGAQRLSPIHHYPGLVDAVPDTMGGVFLLQGDTVRHTHADAVVTVPGAVSLAPATAGVWVATDDGPRFVRADGVIHGESAEAVVRVYATDACLWTATAEGVVTCGEESFSTGATVVGFAPDGLGMRVATDVGLFSFTP
jgi:hypothetical protein